MRNLAKKGRKWILVGKQIELPLNEWTGRSKGNFLPVSLPFNIISSCPDFVPNSKGVSKKDARKCALVFCVARFVWIVSVFCWSVRMVNRHTLSLLLICCVERICVHPNKLKNGEPRAHWFVPLSSKSLGQGPESKISWFENDSLRDGDVRIDFQ